jgi:hypothetical protein
MERNKNKFVAFLTFSDIYVCFTLFTLHAMIQRIPDESDILIPTWQPPPQSNMPVPQWSPWPSSGSSVAQLATILLNLAKPIQI